MAPSADAFGPYRGAVDQVDDGDTAYAKLDVEFDLTVYTRIRINGIDAPELSTQEAVGSTGRSSCRLSHR